MMRVTVFSVFVFLILCGMGAAQDLSPAGTAAAPSDNVSPGQDTLAGLPSLGAPVVFEVSADGYAWGPTLTGFFVTADGGIYTFENSENQAKVEALLQQSLSGATSVSQVEGSENPENPEQGGLNPGESGSLTSPPQENQEESKVTPEYLRAKYGPAPKQVGTVDRGRLEAMMALIPKVRKELPLAPCCQGDDIIYTTYWAYSYDSPSGRLRPLAIATSCGSRPEKCREDEASRTLCGFLTEIAPYNRPSPAPEKAIDSEP